MRFPAPTTSLRKGQRLAPGFTWPGYATSSGFLSLLTSYSALILSALFHAESVHGVEALRGFSLPLAATAFAALCPKASVPEPKENRYIVPQDWVTIWSAIPERSPGINACGRFVHNGVGLSILHRPILSQPSFPSRNSPLEPWLIHIREKPPLMGLSRC